MLCPLATGVSFTGDTVIDTVAMLESTVPSFALNVKESEPLKLSAGVYVRFDPVPVRVPEDGELTMERVKGSEFASDEARTIVIGVSSTVLTDWLPDVGGTFD